MTPEQQRIIMLAGTFDIHLLYLTKASAESFGLFHILYFFKLKTETAKYGINLFLTFISFLTNDAN